METSQLNNKQHLKYLHTNQPEDLDIHPIPNDTINRHKQDPLREFVPILEGSGGNTIPSLISPSRQLLKNISNQTHKPKHDRKKRRAQKYHGKWRILH